ncbi:hypothetical protein [Paraburkholderia sp. D1E]|uniref:hypothetical protein n=1 Tax=Paraburkholderia sp. D1E TaxID=3461398 RepID=UPI004045B5EB
MTLYELLSNLNAAQRVKMRLEFARLHDELKTTMIDVTQAMQTGGTVLGCSA